MSDAIPPVTEPPPVSGAGRGRSLVVLGRPEENANASQEEPRERGSGRRSGQPAGAVGAQLLGERPRRGLKAGPEVLEQARATYLQNEYAGPADRRPRKGSITKTDV